MIKAAKGDTANSTRRKITVRQNNKSYRANQALELAAVQFRALLFYVVSLVVV